MTSSAMGPLPSPTLISACLDDMVQALSDRGEPSDARRADNARAAMTVILSFLPGDVLQMMLAGQAVMFNALIADAGRDVLRGMADTLKLRAQANVTGMGRVLSKHLDTLIRLQGRLPAARAKGKAAAKDTGIETDVERGSGFEHDAPPDPVDGAAAGAVSMPVDEAAVDKASVDKASVDKASVDKAPSVPVNGAAAGARPVPAGEAVPVAVHAARAVETPDIPDPSTWRRPETESWLNDPYKEWVLDTPAALAARAAVPEVKRKTAALSIARGVSQGVSQGA